MTQIDFRHLLREIAEQGLSISDVAKQIGMADNGLRASFKNKSLRVDKLVAICELLNISLDYALNGPNDKPTDKAVDPRIELLERRIALMEKRVSQLQSDLFYVAQPIPNENLGELIDMNPVTYNFWGVPESQKSLVFLVRDHLQRIGKLEIVYDCIADGYPPFSSYEHNNYKLAELPPELRKMLFALRIFEPIGGYLESGGLMRASEFHEHTVMTDIAMALEHYRRED